MKAPTNSTVGDQPFDLCEIRFIDIAHLGCQFWIMKPFLGFDLLQMQKIKQSHARLHHQTQRELTVSRAQPRQEERLKSAPSLRF